MKNKKVLLRIILAACIVFLAVLAYWTVIPRQGTLDIPGEGIYNGQLRGHTFHGYGTYTSYTVGGTSYEGEWRNGVFHGQGTLTYANGSRLTGEFRNGSVHGVATIICPAGETSELDFGDTGTEPAGSCSCCGHGH